MSRLRRYVENCTADYRVIVTLTYGEVFPGARQAKAHLWAYLRWQMAQAGCASVLWVLEYQSRGAPHFHLLIDSPFQAHETIARAWHRATDRCSSLSAGTSIEAIRGARAEVGRYLSKIALEVSKKRQKNQSDEWSGRYWGVRGVREVYPVDAVAADLPVEIAMLLADEVRCGSRGGCMRFPGGQWSRWTSASTME